jgi:hypothetical protein
MKHTTRRKLMNILRHDQERSTFEIEPRQDQAGRSPDTHTRDNAQGIADRRLQPQNQPFTGAGGPRPSSDLESRGVRELRWRARQSNLPGRSKMNKQQLIEALRQQMAEQERQP